MDRNPKNILNWLICLLVVFSTSTACQVLAQDQTPDNRVRQPSVPALADQESRIAERFNRLELLAGRLAELSRSTQPRRARLLRELVSQSRDQDIAGRFELIVSALQEERLANAADAQGKLRVDLQQLLELLLQEDRDRQIESERKRIKKYLAELKKLIRLQRGIKARTDGGDQSEQLMKDQQRVAEATGKLRDRIEETEGPQQSPNAQPRDAEKESKESKGGDPAQKKPEQSGQGKPEQSEPKPSEAGKPSQGNSKKGEQGNPSPSSPNQGSPSEGQPSPGGPQQKSQQEPQQTPAQRSAERLKQAKQRMQQAQEQLEKAKREKAVEKQEQALRELEQAKAELERILRQLREEELERTLVLLEARFRKMLKDQVEVYEQSQELDANQSKVQTHELEIASGRLGRKESQIIRDADRALILLREDATSVAFPEALEQAREDMAVVAKRLSNVKFGMITQGLEEDVIATLEEILAALQNAIKKLREQKSRQQQGKGQPGEQPLVDQLAELRMIRALQTRINKRTKRYDGMIEGEQALEAELLEALARLSLRQERVYQATHDLDTGRNQ